MGIFKGLFKSRDKSKNSYDSPSYSYYFGRANSKKLVNFHCTSTNTPKTARRIQKALHQEC